MTDCKLSSQCDIENATILNIIGVWIFFRLSPTLKFLTKRHIWQSITFLGVEIYPLVSFYYLNPYNRFVSFNYELFDGKTTRLRLFQSDSWKNCRWAGAPCQKKGVKLDLENCNNSKSIWDIGKNQKALHYSDLDLWFKLIKREI